MNLQVVSKCYSFVGKGSQPNHIGENLFHLDKQELSVSNYFTSLSVFYNL